MNGQREIDKTHLSCDQAEERGFLHRDYIAHCLRWSHIVKYLGPRYKDARILDIGCGKETPLIKTLYTMRMTPDMYVGVDANKGVIDKVEHLYNKIYDKMEGGKFELFWNFDASEPAAFQYFDFIDDFTPTLITCFEVLEHVTPKKVIGILDNIRKVADSQTKIFISTPCFNGKAAANHINEMTYNFMTDLMWEYFHIDRCWGTFASQKDIEPMIDQDVDEIQHLYEELKSYYDSNLLSVIFAPLFPSKSRNCMWKLSLKT